MKANKGEKQIDKEGHRISMKILAKVSLTFLSTFLQHRSPTIVKSGTWETGLESSTQSTLELCSIIYLTPGI